MCPLCLASPHVLPERTGWQDYFNLSVNHGYDRIFIEIVTTTCKISRQSNQDCMERCEASQGSSVQCKFSSLAWWNWLEVIMTSNNLIIITMVRYLADLNTMTDPSINIGSPPTSPSQPVLPTRGGTCLCGRLSHWLSKETNSWSQSTEYFHVNQVKCDKAFLSQITHSKSL